MDTHGNYALNDLVLEMSHLVDQDTVRKIELTLLENQLKKDWDLRDEFKLANPRNKEADLALKEIEEMAWRLSG